jgi:hypothetical protein
MITSVTTTTVTTVTVFGVSSFTLVAICTMLLMLLNKELILTSNRAWAVRLRTVLNIAIVPLMVVFVTTIVMKVVDVLR